MAAAAPAPGLAQVAARGVAWSLLAAAGGRAVALVSLAVLARLLSPADFGLVAFALVYLTYVETVADVGLGAAVIWWPRPDAEDAAQVSFVIGVALAVVWVALTWIAAPWVAAFFRTPAGEPLLRVLACAFLVKALGNTHDALGQKALRFRARAVPELGQALVKAALSVALAVAGFGAWSLAWGHLGGQLVWTALAWSIVGWRPRWRWPSQLLAPMAAYGRGIVSVNVLAAIVHHADLVVVGRVLGAAALGLYQVAYKLPETAVTVLVWVTSRVLFPTLARLDADTGALGRGWLAAVRHTSLLTFPVAAGLAVCAAPVVHLFFGARWAPAAPILAGLAVAAGLRSAGTHAGDVLKAAGRPGLLATLGLAKAAVLVPALLAAASWGPAAVAWTMAGVTAFTAVLSIVVAARQARVALAAYAAAAAPAAGVAACVAAASWLALRLAGGGLPLALLAAAAAFAASARMLAAEAMRVAWSVLRGPRPWGWRAGRLLVPAGERPLRRFLLRQLYAPHTRRDRLALELPDRLAAPLVLKPAIEAPPSWPRAARAALGGDEALQAALEESRWVASERVAGRADEGLLLALFETGGTVPRAALKLRPVSPAQPLRNEFEVLRAIRPRLPPALAATVPEPRRYAEAEGWEALLLPWIPGRSAYVEMHAGWRAARCLRAHLLAAVDWLAELQRHTREDEECGVAHGDYWTRNILLGGGAVAAVLDWEQAGPGRPLTDDVFHLVLTCALGYRWTAGRELDNAEAFHRAFLDPSPVSRAIAEALLRYCARAGFDPRQMRARFEHYLATLEAHRGRSPVWLAGLSRASWSVFAG